ncbi:MAG: TRAP transporter substrate-binding protein [Planctomycetes bacterium]|nr:TRAP transporter substrate-binding protein [Planctomycetota bacterium]
MRIRAVVAALAAGLLAASGMAGTISIDIAVHQDPGHPTFVIGEKMRDTIERLSDGRMTATVLGLEVGGERDHLEGASSGEYTIALGGNVPLTLYAPRFAAPDLPFVYSSSDQSRFLYQGELGRLMNEDLIKNGNMRLVGLTYRPARKLTANRPIHTVDDLRGLKLRVPQVKIFVDMWNQLGALTSPIAWTEVYTALQSGVIEAQENPVDLIYASRIYEVQKYLIDTDHVFSFFHWLMNEDFYQSLSEEDRAIVMQAIEEVTAWGDELIMGDEAGYFEKLIHEGKMESIQPDMDSIRAKAKPVIEQACSEYHPDVAAYVMGLFNQ